MIDWMLVLVGPVLLLGGGEALVRGASGIALLARAAHEGTPTGIRIPCFFGDPNDAKLEPIFRFH